jgi:ribose 5-phosphate isomerase RpiB
MIFTARQLEALHRSNGSNGQIVLPYRARLTPLAVDWLKDRKIQVGYSDVETKPADAVLRHEEVIAEQATILWWADGACGPSKAAVMSLGREANVKTMEIAVDAKRMVSAIKLMATEIKAGRAKAGILLVENAATAMVYANRCPSLRAVLGTCREAVEQGISLVGANVLVIEHRYKTLPQVKTMLGMFVKGSRRVSDEVAKLLKELSTCA